MTVEVTSAESIGIDAALVRRLVDAQFPQWSDLPIRPVEIRRLGQPDLSSRRADDGQAAECCDLRAASGEGAALAAEACAAAAAGHPHPFGDGRADRGLSLAVVHLPVDRRRYRCDRAHRRSRPVCDRPCRVSRGLAADRRHRRAGARTAQFLSRRVAGLLRPRSPAGDRHAWRQDRRQGCDRGVGGGARSGMARHAGLVPRRRQPSAICWSRTASSAPSSTSGRRAWAIRLATSTSPGPSSTGESRDAFRAVLPLDDATWARGRGWTLWKALIVHAGLPGTDVLEAEKSRRVIDEILADHQRA